jgi:hypothetical protein
MTVGELMQQLERHPNSREGNRPFRVRPDLPVGKQAGRCGRSEIPVAQPLRPGEAGPRTAQVPTLYRARFAPPQPSRCGRSSLPWLLRTVVELGTRHDPAGGA